MEGNKCMCGCGGVTKGKWVRGHHSRVNNVSKRADIKERRSERFKQMHASGKLGKAWNKGLSKETDERVAAYGKTRSSSFSEEEKMKLSNQMRENRLSGIVPTLYGPDHSQWKGGVSSIVQRLRGSALYKHWKRPILERDGFRCKRCGVGSEGMLEVHHDQERFATIVQRFLPADHHQLSWDEETGVVEKIVDYHVTASVSGVTLCHGCHDSSHEEKSL